MSCGWRVAGGVEQIRPPCRHSFNGSYNRMMARSEPEQLTAPVAFSPATLVRFSRLHTVIATSVQVVCLYLIAGGAAVASVGGLFVAWLACLLANLYVVGLNQLTDVAIDRVNKPALPLARGDLSPRRGRAIEAAPDALVCADGASCRQQIEHFTRRHVYHVVEVLAQALDA